MAILGPGDRRPYILGGIMVAVGCLTIVWQAANVGIHELTSVACAGFWCGAVFIVTGTFGILAGRNSGSCSLISWSAFSLLSVVFGLTQLAIGIIGTWLESMAPMTDSSGGPTTPYPLREAKMSLDVLLALCGLTATIVAIVSSVVTIKATCARRSVPYETMGQQSMAVAYVESPTPNNTDPA